MSEEKTQQAQKPPENPKAPPLPAGATPPKPEDRAIKSGQVKVRVVTHSLFEDGKRYVKGQVFVTTRERARGLKGFVDVV